MIKNLGFLQIDAGASMSGVHGGRIGKSICKWMYIYMYYIIIYIYIHYIYIYVSLPGQIPFENTTRFFFRPQHFFSTRCRMKVGTIDPRAHEVFVSDNLLRQVRWGWYPLVI